MRATLAESLSRRSDTLIMASATPHDGKAASFASLMNMLNPTAIANPEDYGPQDIKGLFLRRYKKDVQAQLSNSFLERKVSRFAVPASAQEESAYDMLGETNFYSFDRSSRTGQLLFRTVLEKSLFSSPAACLETVRQRLAKLAKESTPEAEKDRVSLAELVQTLEHIGPGEFSKYGRLLEALRPGGYLEWNPNNPADRLVIFTERLETLHFLHTNLVHDLKLKPEQVAVIHGSGLADVDLQQVVEDFGRDRSPVRLLIASDIASEGLNLHFLCHKLIHFDIPWSLMVFQQRNGRVDRYGQEKQPHIAYFYTQPQHPKIRGDLRILELLIQKDEQAALNIGDPSVFAGVFDAREEEQLTGQAMEQDLAPQQFDAKLKEAAEDDLLAVLFGDSPVPAGNSARGRCHSLPRLFADDLGYVREGLRALHPAVDLQDNFEPERQLVTLTLNDDLRRVFRALPAESLPDDGRLHFTTDRGRVKKAIKDSRAEENKWPNMHLLWDLHPFMEWLNFKLMVAFSRREAPALRLAGTLEEGESLFFMQGEIPNRKGQPVVHEWFAVRFERQRNAGVLPLDEFLKRTQLHTRVYPNPGEFEISIAVNSLLPQAVAEGRRYMSARREEFQKGLQARLEEENASLAGLMEKQLSFLDFEFPEDQTLVGVRRNKKQEHRRRIEGDFSRHRRWVEDTLTTEDSPFLRVAALFIG
jgi:hypothetical protein